MAHDDHTQTISAADYVIGKFGGLAGTAKAIKRPVTTVQGWRIRGQIPQEHWHKLIDAAKARDKLITLEDFLKSHPVPSQDMAQAS
jgi:hypothetical protein